MRLCSGLLLFLSTITAFGTQPGQTVSDVLLKANIVAGNIQTAITVHLLHDPDFQIAKQLPEDKQCPPKILVRHDGSFYFDRTAGQEARAIMEDIRQGLHAIQAATKAYGMDSVALAGGRQYWPKLRDISCGEPPGIRYYDLDGLEQYCATR